MTLPLMRFAAAVAGAALIACGRFYDVNSRTDSTSAARLAQWLKDSAVVDSMSRNVPLDSFEVLTLAMANPSTHGVAVQERACEGLRLSVRFGAASAEMAIERWAKRFDERHPGVRDVIEGLRVPGSIVTIGPKPCGIPDSVWYAPPVGPSWFLLDRPHRVR